jgi:hypothetical protein
MPHVIRLREPWQHSEIPGGTRHARSFNWLANLLPGQRVWLVIDAIGLTSVVLNGSPIGQASRLSPESRQAGRLSYDITALLAPRNEVILEFTGEQTQLGKVRLEIDDPPATDVDERLRQSVADADAGRTRLMREVVQALGSKRA